jgi:flagellar biosynthesis protein FlhF
MQLHTFKARSLAEALRLVRDELGPDASVLHTREVASPLLRLLGGHLIEVTASAELAAPSRLPQSEPPQSGHIPPAELQDYRCKIRQDLLMADKSEASLVEQLSAGQIPSQHNRLPAATPVVHRLRRAGVSDATARRWLDQLEAEQACDPDGHVDRRLDRLRRIIAAELAESILSGSSSS